MAMAAHPNRIDGMPTRIAKGSDNEQESYRYSIDTKLILQCANHMLATRSRQAQRWGVQVLNSRRFGSYYHQFIPKPS